MAVGHWDGYITNRIEDIVVDHLTGPPARKLTVTSHSNYLMLEIDDGMTGKQTKLVVREDQDPSEPLQITLDLDPTYSFRRRDTPIRRTTRRSAE